MDAQLKAKWVEALRSGSFAQTKEVLKGPDGFCCLGVLCSVMGAEWTDGEPILGGRSLKDYEGDELLSSDAIDETGLSHIIQGELAGMNDEGKTFSEIADHIEKKL